MFKHPLHHLLIVSLISFCGFIIHLIVLNHRFSNFVFKGLITSSKCLIVFSIHICKNGGTIHANLDYHVALRLWFVLERHGKINNIRGIMMVDCLKHTCHQVISHAKARELYFLGSKKYYYSLFAYYLALKTQGWFQSYTN